MEIKTAWKIVYANACCTLANSCEKCSFHQGKNECTMEQADDKLMEAVSVIFASGIINNGDH